MLPLLPSLCCSTDGHWDRLDGDEAETTTGREGDCQGGEAPSRGNCIGARLYPPSRPRPTSSASMRFMGTTSWSGSAGEASASTWCI